METRTANEIVSELLEMRCVQGLEMNNDPDSIKVIITNQYPEEIFKVFDLLDNQNEIKWIIEKINK